MPSAPPRSFAQTELNGGRGRLVSGGSYATTPCPAAIARNETLRATRHYGRSFWKRWTGYHARSRIAAKMTSQVLSDLWRSPARPQGVRRPHQRQRPRPPNRRNPDKHRTDELLLGTRHGRDRSHGLSSKRKRGRHASGPSCATTPRRARNGTRRRQAGGRTKDQGRDPEPLCGPGNAAK